MSSRAAFSNAGRWAIAILLVAGSTALCLAAAVAAEDIAPVVSPDRIDDAPSIKPDPYPYFDNFAWRAFIALNWPSLTDPSNRGIPDRAKTLGDPGPRVWETFKARYELFQVDPDGHPIAPQPWATYEAVNPCGADVDNRTKTLATFDAFMDFNQSAFLPGVAANPLVAQNHTYTRYEARINEPEYSALAHPGWSLGQNLPDPAHPAQLPVGSIAIKAAWRPLTAADTPGIRARYYVVDNANVVDVAKTLAVGHVVCSKSDVALVGMHIVIRTKDRPQGLWSTFEHVDNVPAAGEGEAREAINQRGHAQSREQSGDLEIGDQHAVEHPGGQGEQISQQHGDWDRRAAVGKMERPGGRHGIDRDDRKIDSATDYKDGHTHAEYAQS